MQLKFKKTLTSLLILTPLVITPVILLSNSTPLNDVATPITKSTRDTFDSLDYSMEIWTSTNNSYQRIENGDVYSWGASFAGETGLGETTDVLTPTLLLDSDTPSNSKGDFINLNSGDTIIDMWTMNASVIVTTSNNNLYSWGNNQYGQTGQGGTTDVLTPTLLLDSSDPTKSKGDFLDLSIGDTITNAWTGKNTIVTKTTNGNLYSWGYNGEDQTGQDVIGNVLSPKVLFDVSDPSLSKGELSTLPLGTTVSDIWSSSYNFFLKMSDGNVYSWGYNSSGETGLDETVSSISSPKLLLNSNNPSNSKGNFTNLDPADTIIKMWNGYKTLVAKTTNGNVYSWGDNFGGQVGDGTIIDVIAPKLILDSSTPTNSQGDFANLNSGDTIESGEFSYYTSLFKTSNGNVYSWGYNVQGQTGQGGTTNILSPTLLLDASDPSLSKGDFASLAIGDTIVDIWSTSSSFFVKTTNGDVYSWGRNDKSQTGQSGITDVLTPTLLLDSSDPAQSKGDFINLSIGKTVIDAFLTQQALIVKTSNNNLYSWGYNRYGQTGLGGTTNVLTPTLFKTETNSSLIPNSEISNITTDSATLTWTYAPMIGYYGNDYVEKVEILNGTNIIATVNAITKSYTLTNLEPGTYDNYSFNLLSLNGVNKAIPIPSFTILDGSTKDDELPSGDEVPSGGGMSTGALIGIIIGSIVGVGAIAGGAWWYIKKIR